ncbi:MAG: LacI family DNA-binding transcriptional regulator [Caldilineaceae bacterium]
MSKANVTIQDIARHAGVGVGTVSRVINASPKVDPATRQHVQAVIAELGYRPKSAAKILRTRKTHEIGFITDEIATTPFAVDVIRGAQDAAWAQGKLLVLINTNRNSQVLEAAIETMLERQVEGLLYAAMFHQQVSLPANIYELPAVLVDCFCEDRSLPSVVPNEIQGSYVATELLLQQGHRRIGHMTNVELYPARTGRIAGYQQALSDYGVVYEPTLLCEEWTDPQGGYRAAKRLMQQENRPTALFCFNDRMAMGTYAALNELGLRIPEDVAIVSYDNQELLAANLRPTLTSMQLPHYAMGQWAVNYLLNSTNHNDSSAPPQVTLECPLVIRESHGKELHSGTKTI